MSQQVIWIDHTTGAHKRLALRARKLQAAQDRRHRKASQKQSFLFYLLGGLTAGTLATAVLLFGQMP